MFNIFSRNKKNKVLKSKENNKSDKGDIFTLVSINFFVKEISEKTRELHKLKYFNTSLYDSRIEKNILLLSEIGELTDAIKKGNGEEKEAEELADIYIRACNYLCADETYVFYTKLSESLNNKSIFDENFSILISKDLLDKEKLVYKKFAVLEAMYEQCYEIKKESITFLKARYTEEEFKYRGFLRLWSQVMRLICLCEFYSNHFLNSGLRLAVTNKMNNNFNREARFNTCKEMYE